MSAYNIWGVQDCSTEESTMDRAAGAGAPFFYFPGISFHIQHIGTARKKKRRLRSGGLPINGLWRAGGFRQINPRKNIGNLWLKNFLQKKGYHLLGKWGLVCPRRVCGAPVASWGPRWSTGWRSPPSGPSGCPSSSRFMSRGRAANRFHTSISLVIIENHFFLF